jgi:oxaloacetate decarboxylase alpha subunit
MNVLAGERYKLMTRETEDIVRGMYGQTPAPINPELLSKVLGDEKQITVRPADLIDPELEVKRRDIGDLAESDEDVLSYTIFPQIAKPFFEIRHDDAALKKAIAAQQPKKPAAAAAAPSGDNSAYTVTVNGNAYNVTVAEGHDSAVVVQDVQPVAAAPVAPAAPAPAAGGGAGEPVESPMGGNVWKLTCNVGDAIQVGDVVMVLEAMKMEVEVTSTHSGSVQSIVVKEGDAVAPGQVLMTIG